jgi:hypothetical protein
MSKWLVLSLSVLLSWQVMAKDDDCGDNVDMADSLDFQKMHVDCADDPISLYDPESVGGFLSGNKKAVTVYEKTDRAPVIAPVAKPKKATMSVFDMTDELTTSSVKSRSDIVQEIVEQDNAGVVFNIREPFIITAGPQSAISGLFVQMAQYCPVGWDKLKEWVAPAQSQAGYYLHYQFQCAK